MAPAISVSVPETCPAYVPNVSVPGAKVTPSGFTIVSIVNAAVGADARFLNIPVPLINEAAVGFQVAVAWLPIKTVGEPVALPVVKIPLLTTEPTTKLLADVIV